MAEAPDISVCESTSSDGDEYIVTPITESVTASLRELQGSASVLLPYAQQPGPDSFNITGSQNQVIKNCNIYVTQQTIESSQGNFGNTHNSTATKAEFPAIADTRRHNRRRGRFVTGLGTQSKTFRVVPFSNEMKDSDDQMTITVWFCREKEYNGILKGEHEMENVTLDSYDTFRVQGGHMQTGAVTVTIKANDSNTWIPESHQQQLNSMQIWRARKTKCAFRLQREPTAKRDQLYITLTIHQEVSGVKRQTEFILQKRICDIGMSKDKKAILFEASAMSNKNTSSKPYGISYTDDYVCSVVPYVDQLFHVDNDLIVTVWLCPEFDDDNTNFEALKKEQEAHSRMKLDFENSFLIRDWNKPVMAAIEMCSGEWEFRSSEKQKELDPLKLDGGQTKCQFVYKSIDNTPNIDVKISLWQPKERNKIEFRKTTKMEKFQVIDTEPRTSIPSLMSVKLTRLRNYVTDELGQGNNIPNKRRKGATSVVHCPTCFDEFRLLKWHAEGINAVFGDEGPARTTSQGARKFVAQAQGGDDVFVGKGPARSTWQGGYNEFIGVGQSGYNEFIGGGQGGYNEFIGGGSARSTSDTMYEYEDIFSLGENVFRVTTLAIRNKDNNEIISLAILLCDDDRSLFQTELEKLMEEGYFPLDTYDTFVIRHALWQDCPVNVTYYQQTGVTEQRIDVASLFESRAVTHVFKMLSSQTNENAISWMKIQQIGKEPEEASFALHFTAPDNSLNELGSSSTWFLDDCLLSWWQRPDSELCYVVPYADHLQVPTGDFIITIWLCSFDDESRVLLNLEHEQFHVGRVKLDSSNSFIILDKEKPIIVEITEVESNNKRKEVSTKRVLEGGRAKVQFFCQLPYNEDEDAFLGVDITVHQEGEMNKIQFLSRKKVSQLSL